MLLPHLTGPRHSEALRLVMDILEFASNDRERTEVLSEIGRVLDKSAFPRALALARGLPGLPDRAEALIALVHSAPEPDRQALASGAFKTWYSAYEETEELTDLDFVRARTRAAVALVKLTGYFDDVPTFARTVAGFGVLKRAELAKRGKPILLADHPYLALVPHMPEHARPALWHEMRDEVRKFTPDLWNSHRIGEVLDALPEAERTPFADRIFSRARWRPGRRHRDSVTSSLIPYLSPRYREHAIERALTRSFEHAGYAQGLRSELTKLAPYLSHEMVMRAFSAPWLHRDVDSCVTALVALLPFLPEDERQLSTVVSMVERLDNVDEKASALRYSVGWAVEPWQSELLGTAITFTNKNYTFGRASGWADLVPHMTGARRQRMIRRITRSAKLHVSRNERIHALSTVISVTEEPHRKEQLRDRALDLTKNLRDEHRRHLQLTGLAASDDPVFAARLLPEIRRLHAAARLPLLRTVLPRLDEPHRTEVARELLDAIQRFRHQWSMDDVLIAVAELGRQLPSDLVQETHHAVLAMTTVPNQAVALAALAERLDDAQLQQGIDQVLTAARSVPDQITVLAPLLPWLPAEVREALAAQDITETVMGAYAPYLVLTEDNLLTLAPYRDDALARLIPELTADDRRDAFAFIAQAGPASARIALAEFLTELPTVPAAALASVVRSVTDRWTSRPAALIDLAVLAPAVSRLGGEAAVSTLTRAIVEVSRWWP
jgi:hypothetical protein